MSKDLLVFDFDSTIVNSSKAVYSVYCEDEGVDFDSTWVDDIAWNFKPIIDSRTELVKALSKFVDKRMTDRMKFIDGAKEVLDMLSEKYDILIVSKQHVDRREHTIEYVNKHLPYARIEFTDSFDKSYISKYNPIAFIDDRVDALDSVSEANGEIKCILFGNYHWNKYVTKYDRCVTWGELEGLLND